MKVWCSVIVGLMFTAMLLAAPGCAKSAGDQAAAKAAEAPFIVSVAKVGRENIERRIDITGTLAAWEEATMASEVDGRVVAVAADLGDRVARGEVLARVASEEYELRVAQAVADLTSAQADYTRTTGLAAKHLVSQQQVDDAKHKLDVAQAAADLAQKKLRDTTLRAPFDGAVAKRLINTGDYVHTGMSAFQLVRTTPLKFKGEAPEQFAFDVRVGDAVLAYLSADNGEPLHGKIVRIGPAVSADSRSFAIEAQIENPNGKIKPGTFARLSILSKTVTSALTIPDRAVFSFAGNPHVYVVAAGKARDRAVEMAGKTADRVVVVKGLEEGEQVVITGVELLTDGRAVTIRAEAAQ
jgi:membrane fusion protein (multidrug efflux system)